MHPSANEDNTSEKLKGREIMFQYQVEKESVMLDVALDPRIKEDFLYSEFADLDLTFTNPSSRGKISHVYLITSHPVFFGFT
jgi:hypothetical protein